MTRPDPCTHRVIAVDGDRHIRTWRAANADAAQLFAAALQAADNRRRYEVQPLQPDGAA